MAGYKPLGGQGSRRGPLPVFFATERVHRAAARLTRGANQCQVAGERDRRAELRATRSRRHQRAGGGPLHVGAAPEDLH